MNDRTSGAALWSASASAKEKNAAHRAVVELLDALAPEQAVRRGERPRNAIERYRTPAGCVLQASNAALSVSWFPEAAEGSPIGELRVILWEGTVARRGAPRAPGGGARVVQEILVRPQESGGDTAWLSGEGVKFDTASLAEHCIALLDRQIAETPAAAS